MPEILTERTFEFVVTDQPVDCLPSIRSTASDAAIVAVRERVHRLYTQQTVDPLSGLPTKDGSSVHAKHYVIKLMMSGVGPNANTVAITTATGRTTFKFIS